MGTFLLFSSPSPNKEETSKELFIKNIERTRQRNKFPDVGWSVGRSVCRKLLHTAHALDSFSTKPYAKHPATDSFSHKMKKEWLEAEHNTLEDSRCQIHPLNKFIFNQNWLFLNAFTHLIQCRPSYPISTASRA